MSAYYDSDAVRSLAMDDARFIELDQYAELIEHDGHFGAHSLQAVAENVFNDMTPKPNYSASQGHAGLESTRGRDGKLPIAGDIYDTSMSTPPLSPSTTASSLHTDGYSANYYSPSDEYLVEREVHEEIIKGKQPEILPLDENVPNGGVVGQEDEDWYGMQYALERSRMDCPEAVWPPSAGESSTSDAAFVAMYDGHIYPQDVEYWYSHWCKWHRALAREEKRRRDRASSDAKHTRTYHHATYAQWEQAERKKYMQQAPGNAVGSKSMTSSRGRHRSSTCLF